MGKLFRGLMWLAGILVVLGGALRLTMLRTWRVPDNPALAASVTPSLRGGDLVVLLRTGKRGFGDLVRCADPEEPSADVVGRIVGVAGDNVELDPSGFVIVNRKRYSTTEQCVEQTFEVEHPTSGAPEVARCTRVEMAGSWHYMSTVAKVGVGAKVDHEVGVGRVYLLSDNRSFHDDSRDFGPLMETTCKERVLFRLWGKEGFFGSDRRFNYVP